MSAPDTVRELVERFERNLGAYRSGKYNETQVRREFVDPFFEALGWDVMNKQGYAEAYKDVIHEDSIRIGAMTKAPDYCFRIGGTRKFFLETKKPSVNIKSDTHPAYQLRRYAWSAKLPLSILTDFEEFAVYDCRARPVQSDKASKARIMYLRFEEYLKRWDEIAAIFARDAILKGSFDKFAESVKGKRGTAEVDDEFLKEIESWREALARNFALRNPQLSTRDLNFAVQRTIDRIIFLRICEDRGVEPYGRLLALCNGVRIYARLCELFRHADDRYNSGLFHFKAEKGRLDTPDELSLALNVDDKVIKGILKRMYYPESPYEFSVLPADILGQVYERFLGKVIRLTAGHQAKIEEKPEVRKAGGVYYTPTYIVDYIVKNTVGKLLDGSTPRKASKLRILDPACGSGSFLIGAYQCLLDWHRDWYVNSDPGKHAKGKSPALYEGRGGEWKLTTAERRRILLNNIYGVDIDQQAVEVTKLSLLLKVLEGESEQSLNNQLILFQERALPDLGSNIKCGNSLIGPDFYETGQPTLFDIEEAYRINAFDWEAEFPEILKRKAAKAGKGKRKSGFDAVIGNPPYGATIDRDQVAYCVGHSPMIRAFPDSYCMFVTQGASLLKHEGVLSYIVPNTFCDLESCVDLRKWLLTEKRLEWFWQTGWAFKAAVVDTLVFGLRNVRPGTFRELQIEAGDRRYVREYCSFLQNDLAKIDYRNSTESRELLTRVNSVRRTMPLARLATVRAGVKLYEKGKGIPAQTAETLKERPFTVREACPPGWRVLYRGTDVTRYALARVSETVKYGAWLAAPRKPELFDEPKILMRRTDDRLMSCLDSQGAVCVNSCHVIQFIGEVFDQMSYCYLLGLLNSKLMQTIFELTNPQMVGKVFAEIKVIYVERLPIRTIDFDNPAEVAKHDRMVALVDRMLELNRQLQAAKIDHDKTLLQRQIDATDIQIDRLVYDLYGLTDEEIRIVEEYSGNTP